MAPDENGDADGRTADREPAIDLAAARHPAEPSRLLLAQCAGVLALGVAAVLVVEANRVPGLVIGVVLAAASLVVVWLSLQLRRARLLGSALRVTADSLPWLHAELTGLRDRLDYHRPVDVYVAENVDGKAALMSFLGQRVILLEGDFIAEFESDESRPACRFLLGSLLGSLKARHTQLAAVVLLLRFVDFLTFAKPLLLPYYRATRYTGDQIGYLCADDIPAALATIARLLMGKDLAPAVAARSLIEQAEHARAQRTARLAQLFSESPHLTNRYLNVIAFAASASPQRYRTFLERLDQDTRRRLTAVLNRFPAGKSRPAAAGGQPASHVWPLLLTVGLVIAGLVIAIRSGGSTQQANPFGRVPTPAVTGTLPALGTTPTPTRVGSTPSREPTASGSATPPGSVADTAQVGDCFVDRGSRDTSDLAPTSSCGPGTYKLVQRLTGTTDTGGCDADEHATGYNWAVSYPADDVVLCLRYRYRDEGANAQVGDCVDYSSDGSSFTTRPTGCARGTFQVIATFHGTRSYRRCKKYATYDLGVSYTNSRHPQLDVVLCMTFRYPDDAGHAVPRNCMRVEHHHGKPRLFFGDCTPGNAYVTARYDRYYGSGKCGHDGWEAYDDGRSQYSFLDFTVCWRWIR